MFLRKKAKKPLTGIRENVAGITSQIDHLLAIVQDSSSSASDRITACEIVRSFVDFQSLSSVTEIWYATSSLTSLENSPEVRRAGWRLCLSCIARDEMNNSAFTAYYTSIIQHANIEDFDLVLACLEQLTKGGRRVVGAQAPKHLPQVLLDWIQMLAIRSQGIRNNSSLEDIASQWGVSTETSFHNLMSYTIALLKLNMPVWEPTEIEELLLVVVAIVRQTSPPKDCELCCSLIEAVVAYGLFPVAVLQPILEVLCGIIAMVPSLKSAAERLIVSLTTGHLRNSTFVRLCRILDSPNADITTSMQIAAAQQLERLLCLTRSESRRSGDSGTVLDDRRGDEFIPIEFSLPANEVLQCYYATAMSESLQTKLLVALVQCCIDLITDFGLLKWLRSTGIPDTEEAPAGSFRSLVTLFDERYAEMKDSPEKEAMFTAMQELATLLVDSLADKDLMSGWSQQVLLSIRISKFMSVETCEALLVSISRMQFCTPGVFEWFAHLQEVMKYIYTKRTDRCRAHVLRSIQDIYALDSKEEGWISKEDLAWLTSTTFEALHSADDETLQTILDIYETRVFYTEHLVFTNATTVLANAAVNGTVKAAEALVFALSRAYKLHAKQALTILDALQRIALEAPEKPEIFRPVWAVLCRLRSDRWDRLCFINLIAEEAYGPALLEKQAEVPESLLAAFENPSLTVKIRTKEDDSSETRLDTARFLEAVLGALKCSSEDTFIVVVINLASQLGHYQFLCNPELPENFEKLRLLRDEMMHLVSSGGAQMPEEMPSSRRNACLNVLVHALTVLQPLRELFSKSEHDKMVQIIIQSLGQRNINTNWAVHYLLVACYESPSSIQRFLSQIISRLQLRITSRDSSIFILDFLLTISLRSSLTRNFTTQDFKRVFGMSFLFIQHASDMLLAQNTRQKAGAQWHLQLAYAAIANLFLSIKLENRRSVVSYLMRTIAVTNKDKMRLEPQNLVMYDLINRFTYSDVPLRINLISSPAQAQPGWDVQRMMKGFAIFEIRTNRRTGEAFRIVRRPAGVLVTKMEPVGADNQGTAGGIGGGSVGGSVSAGDANGSMNGGLISTSPGTNGFSSGLDLDETGAFSSNFYYLCGQLGLATFNFCSIDTTRDEESVALFRLSRTNPVIESNTDHVSGFSRPVHIPDDAPSLRALRSLDLVPVVDFYKVGLIYVAPGQRNETEILANKCGSPAYRQFLRQVGTLIRLKNNRTHYVGGLDTQQDLDGQFAVAWSSKIAQIIFHATTLMPQLPGDTQFANKKRHIGNDFVNIYFDESGVDFVFDVVKSQFNFINIVITPTLLKHGGQRYWKVRALKKEGMFNSLAAYELKVVSESNLPLFVRNLAFKASQYAGIHRLGADYMDNWVYRLQLISNLRERLVASETKQDQGSSKARKGSDDEETEATSFLSDDDLEESEQNDIGVLSWMDFTKYTV